MMIALGVLVVTTLLVAAMFVAITGDVHISQHDLDGKRAYSAAEAGANTFLYQLNQNPNYWQSCSNDTLAQTQVPGTSPAEYYSYQPIPANGNTSCISTNSIGSLIDKSTGSLRMEFTGYSGGPNSVVRTLVASYRKLSPLDFLWYTVYEALDSSINGYSTCGVFYRAGRNSNCNINWVTGDVMNGPMYTQDQYLVLGSPTFGRGPADKIESLAPGSSASAVCSGNNCGSATFKGTPVWSAPFVPLPNSNSQLLTDATNNGKVYTGTTTISLNNTTATVVNCPSSCTTTTVDLTQYPIIYVSNGSSCSPAAYDPFTATYPTSGCTGDVYVSGTYTTPVTIASANSIIVDGNITTTESSGLPTGGAVLGLVANQFVRVMHGLGANDSNAPGSCGQDNNASQIVLEPSHRRRDPRAQAFVHRRSLRLRPDAREPDDQWCPSTELPGHGRDGERRQHLHRVPQELHLRQPSRLFAPALPVRHLDRRLGGRPRDALRSGREQPGDGVLMAGA